MSAEQIGLEAWIEKVTPQFVEVNEAAQVIGAINSLYDMVAGDEDTDTDTRIIFDPLELADMQRGALENACAVAAAAPYDELEAHRERYAHIVGSLTHRLAQMDDERQRRAANIHGAMSRPDYVAPERGIRDLAAYLEASEQLSCKSPEQKRLENDLATYQREQAMLDGLYFGEAGQAWPLPKLIRLLEQESRPTEEDTSAIPPEGRRKAPDRDASPRLGRTLTTSPWTIYTYPQLGRLVYDDGEPRRWKGRISGLVARYAEGRMIGLGDALDDTGMALQVGRRVIVIHGSNASILPQAVYRAVPVADKDNYDPVLGGNESVMWSDEEWTTIEPGQPSQKQTTQAQ